MTIRQLSTTAGLVSMLVGCSPTSPSPPSFPPATALPTYVLSGIVSEMTPEGPAPVAGALVTDSTFRGASRTDDKGRYTITVLPLRPTTTTVSVIKGGYVARKSLQSISGDTRLDFQLDRRPAYTLSGLISESSSAGPIGIGGIVVEVVSYVSNDEYTSTVATTDDNGRYRVPDLWAGTDVFTGLWLTKAGYRIDPQLSPPCDNCFRTLTITADTVLDIPLERFPTMVGVAPR